MNSQTMILKAIATAVEAHDGVMLIDDTDWANTGTLRTVKRDTLDQIAAVSYNFQSDYCHFGPTNARVAALWYGQSAEGKAAWVCGSISELVAAVGNYLLGKEK